MFDFARYARGRRSAITIALRCVFTVVAAMPVAGPVRAQTQTAVPDAGSGLEEIVVTARRREERLQDTPIAVSAFTAESLERQQVFNTEDLGHVTPSLQFHNYAPLSGNNSAAQVFIRGIGQTDASPSVDPGVGLYIDDVYMGRAVGGVMEFRDIAEVQVLRGPQGTLFGRNTIGGAVLLTSTAPGNELGGTARVTLGDDNLREAFAAVDIPIASQLAARVSAGFRKRDGYVSRVSDGVDLGNENSYTVQSSLRWQPVGQLKLTLRGDYTHADEHGSPFVFAAINGRQAFPAVVSVAAGCPGATFPPPSVPTATVDPRCANSATWNLGPFRNGGAAPVGSTLENWGVSTVAEWAVNAAFTLKAVSAYRQLNWTGERDADNTPLLILQTDYRSRGHQVSQELQALTETGSWHGVIGAFYFKESIDDLLQVAVPTPPPLVASRASPGSRDYDAAQLDNDNWALFSQWTYDITHALSLTAGLRYTNETKKIRIVDFNVSPYTNPTPDPLPAAAPPLYVLPTPFTQDFTATTGSASLQYRWTHDLMSYVSWSQGFKSGGFNQRYNAPPPGNLPIPFKEERARTYELGIKSDWGGVLRANAAVFKTYYDNMQLTYRLGVVPLLFNAGKSSIEGAELELTYAPAHDLNITASASYLRNTIDEIATIVVPGSSVTATVGPSNSLPFTPKWQANVGAGYTMHPGTLLLTPRLDVSYTAAQFFDAANSPEVAQNGGVTVMNASLTLENASRAWRLMFGVNNLSDKVYPVAGNSSLSTSSGYAEIIYARPRNYFVSGTYHF